jgi:GTP cyclohydrolase I
MALDLQRIRPAWLCNEAAEGSLSASEKAAMIAAATRKVEELFDVLRIDHRNDHNTRDTPRRFARMLIDETLRGRYDEPPVITEFENAAQLDQLIVTGPIELRSTCAHHLMPIYGHVMVGILPAKDGNVLGLSKYDRIVDYFASRLQIQEELGVQIGNYIMDVSDCRGLAIRINAVHMCRTHRGVRASHAGGMINTCFFGELRDDHELKNQFLLECHAVESSAEV